MCRLSAFFGAPICAADLVTRPSRSIITQSFDARERMSGDASTPGYLNGDGFGLGWYSADSRDLVPCVYRQARPAWNDGNLGSIAEKVYSPVLFAHVRAASPGMDVSETTCHPFRFGRYLWMHNGALGGFRAVRRVLLRALGDDYKGKEDSNNNDCIGDGGSVRGGGDGISAKNDQHGDVLDFALTNGSSDSALCFAVFLSLFPDKMAHASPDEMRQRLEQTLVILRNAARDSGTTEISLLNFVVSNGDTLVASRFVYDPTNPDADAASLYYASGNDYVAAPASPRDYQMVHVDRRSTLAIISSEPLTECRCDWVQVPRNHVLVVTSTIDIMLFPVCQDTDRISRTLSNLGEDFRSSPKLALQATDAVDLALHFQERFSGRPLHAAPRGDLLTASPCPPRGEVAHLRKPSVPPDVVLPNLAIRTDSALKTPPSAAFSPAQTAPSLRYTIQVKGAAVLSTVVSGVYLCSGTQDGHIRVWHISDRVEAASLKRHTSAVLTLETDESSSILLSGSSDSTICMWKMAAPNLFQCLRVVACSAYGDVFALAVVNRFVFAGFSDTKLRRMTEDIDTVASRAAANGGIGGDDEEASSCFMSTFWSHPIPVQEKDVEAKRSECAHYGYVFALAACHNGAHICSGSGDGLIRVWDAASQHLVRELGGHRGAVLALTVASADNGCSLLFSGSRDGTVKVWDVDSQYLCKRTLRKHKDEVVSCTASGKIVLSGSADGQVYLWCARTLQCIAQYRAPTMHAAALSLPFQLVFIASEHVVQARDLALQSVIGRDATARSRSRVFPAGDSVEVTAQSISKLTMNEARELGVSGEIGTTVTGPKPRTLSQKGTQQGGLIGNGGFSDDEADDEADDEFDRSTVLVPGVPNELVLAPSWDRTTCLPLPADGSIPECRVKASIAAVGELAGSCDQLWFLLRDSRLTEERLMQDVLEQFVSFATVSGDESHRESCWQGAKYLATFLEGIGATVNMVAPSNSAQQQAAPFELTRKNSTSQTHNPIIFARFSSTRQDASTLLFYAHYDVKPANPAEWESDPWVLRALGGHLYGRGVTDNKGPIVAMIFAIKSLLENMKDGLAINIVLVLQGEGEQKNVGFRQAIEANRHWFDGTSLILTSNSCWLGEDRPCLTYSTRGVIDLDVSVSGPAHNLHTGVDGGAIFEPVSDLLGVLATLSDSRGSVSIPGFYDDVKGLTAEERRRLEEVQFELEEYQLRAGVDKFTSSNAAELLELRWRQPCISVSSLDTSNKARLHSVIPFEASAKVSVRFVPNQCPAKLVELIKTHLDHEFKKRRSPNRLWVQCVGTGDWWLGDPSSAEFRLADRAVRAVWGVTPLYVSEGGTMPIFSFLSKCLGAPIVQVPLGQSSDGAHLPNERMRALNLFRGKKVLEHIVRELNEQQRQRRQQQQQQQQKQQQQQQQQQQQMGDRGAAAPPLP